MGGGLLRPKTPKHETAKVIEGTDDEAGKTSTAIRARRYFSFVSVIALNYYDLETMVWTGGGRVRIDFRAFRCIN